jgi:dihydrofolate reductase
MANLKSIEAVLCLQENGGIGLGLDLLFKSKELPGDMDRFKEKTMGKVLIMGSKTWHSIPEKWRNFEGREVIVITRNPKKIENPEKLAAISGSVMEAIHYARTNFPEKGIVCGGGGEIYRQMFPFCTCIWATIVYDKREANIIVKIPDYFQEITSDRISHEHKGLKYDFATYKIIPKNPENHGDGS